eukprot:gnl/MRDRNA2_/MRDRNA2_204173_c0_seq1.p2 gnl/MRDRNA2_/MRDRNA2_204173_c0~~gnl/MRDRNA2_/MRDRNA2_204173_c0_seq1.p2  ORF type:complete len:148 (-),score=18.76 gnl/MRDRNA2_/MRDRNA2_204173_c0_seq1:93-536(-)
MWLVSRDGKVINSVCWLNDELRNLVFTKRGLVFITSITSLSNAINVTIGNPSSYIVMKNGQMMKGLDRMRICARTFEDARLHIHINVVAQNDNRKRHAFCMLDVMKRAVANYNAMPKHHWKRDVTVAHFNWRKRVCKSTVPNIILKR